MVLTSINMTTSICRERVALCTDGNKTIAAARSKVANITDVVDGGWSFGAVSSIDWKWENFSCNAKWMGSIDCRRASKKRRSPSSAEKFLIRSIDACSAQKAKYTLTNSLAHSYMLSWVHSRFSISINSGDDWLVSFATANAASETVRKYR